jgi:PAS domain S-box-containing protein
VIPSVNNLLLRLRFRQKGILLVALPLIFEILFVVLLSHSYGEAQRESLLADHGRRILTVTDAVTTDLFAIGASLFMGAQLGPQALESRYDALQASLQGLVNSLVEETHNYPDEAKFVTQIVASSNDLFQRANGIKQLLKDPLQAMSQIEIRRSRKATSKSLHAVADALDGLIAYEQSMSGPRLIQARKSRENLHSILYGGVALNVLISIWLALVFSKQITSRLRVVSRNAILLSKKEPLKEVVPGHDELSDLDQLMHKLSDMLIETSRRERALIDNTIDVICALSPELSVLTANAAALRKWGWDETILKGTLVTDIVLAEHRQRLWNEFETCRTGGTAVSFDCSLVRKDGSVLESRWSVLWSQKDNSFFCIVRDIGAEKEAERLRQKFFSMITHDLRSPLTNIQSFVQLLKSGQYGTLKDKGKDKVNQLEESLNFLVDLTSDLLDIGKLEAGQLNLLIETFLAETLIDESCTVVESLATAKSIRLNVSGEENCRIKGDFLRLKQVLANLLSNAIKFSPTGATVSVDIQSSSGTTRISVKDEGPGLPESAVNRVFDMYAQAENQAVSSAKGFGIGLSIVKTIVEAHGGEVGVTSSPGSGSEFWLKLPDNLPLASAQVPTG